VATFTNAHKVYVVQALACYERQTDVRRGVKEKFGIEVPLEQIAYYDPTSATGGEPAQKWQELFAETREAYRKGTQEVAIAQKRWRLEQLEDDFRKLRTSDPEAAAALLEQAAKETGGKYTNRTEVSGPDGGPVQVEQDVTLSDAELARIASEDE